MDTLSLSSWDVLYAAAQLATTDMSASTKTMFNRLLREAIGVHNSDTATTKSLVLCLAHLGFFPEGGSYALRLLNCAKQPTWERPKPKTKTEEELMLLIWNIVESVTTAKEPPPAPIYD